MLEDRVQCHEGKRRPDRCRVLVINPFSVDLSYCLDCRLRGARLGRRFIRSQNPNALVEPCFFFLGPKRPEEPKPETQTTTESRDTTALTFRRWQSLFVGRVKRRIGCIVRRAGEELAAWQGAAALH